jgi:uncharacterized membrane protein YoaK (UPF0700 family)
VDAFGFVDLNGVYTAAMTGNTVLLGIALARQHWPAALFIAFTIGSFFCGCLIASLIRRCLPKPALELFIMAALLIVTQGVHGRLPHLPFIELPLLTLAMAMQGETISRFSGISIQTIVVTNNLVKCADALIDFLGAQIVRLRNGTDRAAGVGLVAAIAPGSAWLAYMVGAGGGCAAVMYLPVPLIIPVLFLVVAACDCLLCPA